MFTALLLLLFLSVNLSSQSSRRSYSDKTSSRDEPCSFNAILHEHDIPTVDISTTKYMRKLDAAYDADDEEKCDKYQWLHSSSKSKNPDDMYNVSSYYGEKQAIVAEEVRAVQNKNKKVYNKTKAYLKLASVIREGGNPDIGSQISHCERRLADDFMRQARLDREKAKDDSNYEETEAENHLRHRQELAMRMTGFSWNHFDLIRNDEKQQGIKGRLRRPSERDDVEKLKLKRRKGRLIKEAVLHGDANAAANFAEIHGEKSYDLYADQLDLEDKFIKVVRKEAAWRKKGDVASAEMPY